MFNFRDDFAGFPGRAAGFWTNDIRACTGKNFMRAASAFWLISVTWFTVGTGFTASTSGADSDMLTLLILLNSLDG